MVGMLVKRYRRLSMMSQAMVCLYPFLSTRETKTAHKGLLHLP